MFPTFFRVKASYYLLFWFATQLIYGYARAAGSTAVFAHAGGFVAGIALLPLVADKKRISQFRLARSLGFPPYTIFTPIKTGGLSRTTKAVVAALLASLLVGTAYAFIGLTNQGGIKSATIQYTCEGTSYVDYVGFQLPNVESQLSSISLDTTRILLNRLYAAGLLYNEAEAGGYINISGQNLKLQLNIGGRRVDVDLALDYFKGEYDSDGFLSYGEGNLTTQVIIIYQYGVFLDGQVGYNFQFTSQTVNLTRVTQYTAAPSGVATIAALAVVLKKDKELALIGEESETVRHHFDSTI